MSRPLALVSQQARSTGMHSSIRGTRLASGAAYPIPVGKPYRWRGIANWDPSKVDIRPAHERGSGK